MSFEFLDSNILNDFLTESGELIDELDADLVTLEETPEDAELLNRIFRALHTIKGSASFLAITHLVEFAHKAEDALNVIRKGEAQVDEKVMDALLRSVDVLRSQLTQLEAGADPEAGPADLIEELIRITACELQTDGDDSSQEQSPITAIGDGVEKSEIGFTSETGAGAAPMGNTPTADETPLVLTESKQELVSYMVDDLKDCLGQIGREVRRFENPKELSDAAVELHDITIALSRCVEFFEFDSMATLVNYLKVASNCINDAPVEALEQIVPRLGGIVLLIKMQAQVLEKGYLKRIDAALLGERLINLLLGHPLEAEAHLENGASPADALRYDGVALDSSTEPVPAGKSDSSASETDSSSSALTAHSVESPAADPTSESPVMQIDDAKSAGAKSTSTPPSKVNHRIESTIRVEVSRLETLLNLVGELVTQKNRIAALSRQLRRQENLDTDLAEAIIQSSNDLDHTTGQIQVGVMRTRMQPLDKLFGKYPRMVRDLARNTHKKIDLQIMGGETEVDKSIIEKLGDPLVHILRNGADHGIETAEDRIAAGKSDAGVIRISADHQGSHVMIKIEDDGKGINRKNVGRKAVEKGLITNAELEALSDDEIVNLIMAPGFTTAARVSDLSGRGVGMDVVRTNIHNLGGELTFSSIEGQGSLLTIKIPLTVAILNAMMVKVASETFAIPLTNIIEIVKPDETMLSTVNNCVVLRLRDTVVPVVDLRTEFNIEDSGNESCFAVVVGSGEQQFGLMVTGLIGQQEIVIKPLDESIERNEAISGATVREDGGISLILDVTKIIDQKTRSGRIAA